MAHRSEPVTRQREDQAQLVNSSRKTSLLPGRPWWAYDHGNSGLALSSLGQMKGAATPFIWPNPEEVSREDKRKKCEDERE
jgi:hypothetical protein